MSLPYNFSDDTSEEVKHFIPNQYVGDTSLVWSMLNVYMRCVVLISTEEISDCELYLNYRFNPDNPYPDWYAQPNFLEAKRRWSKDKIWF